MAAGPHSIDPTAYLDELLSQASPDVMRQMLEGFINQILSAQADTVCGAEYGTTSDTRVNLHNGYRHRPPDTRVGTIDVAIPKLRHGSFFPDWLLERRTRVERALTTVIATLLSHRCLHPAHERPRCYARHHQLVEITGQRHGQRARRDG